MTKSEILESLKAGKVDLEFIKADGTLRKMVATLSDDFIVYASTPTNSKKQNEFALPVWDTEVNAWRSFRWDSLKLVNGVDIPAGSLLSAA
tara:strand:+ start:621 stop:893 length:273 start_codon:yes stop_codon:yes gene_type:complete